MKHKIFTAMIFACFGVTAEILFTGIKYNIVLPLLNHEKINYILAGQSYVWMIFIYGAIPFLFPLIYRRVHALHIILRIIIYASVCLLIEYICGWLLDVFTGDCPWRYTEGLHVNGYIRLDYFPAWLLFGYGVELLWRRLEKKNY